MTPATKAALLDIVDLLEQEGWSAPQVPPKPADVPAALPNSEASVRAEREEDILEMVRILGYGESEARLRRESRGSGALEPLAAPGLFTGLALSGGGIRSSTFHLGALDFFANELRSVTRRMRGDDYLSTVSGGGYVSAWLLKAMSKVRGGQGIYDPINIDSWKLREHYDPGVPPEVPRVFRCHKGNARNVVARLALDPRFVHGGQAVIFVVEDEYTARLVVEIFEELGSLAATTLFPRLLPTPA